MEVRKSGSEVTLSMNTDTAKISKLYVVTMYRFMDRESHSYVLGVFTQKHMAKQAAELEKQHRGGNKYYPEILEVVPNAIKQSKHVLALEE